MNTVLAERTHVLGRLAVDLVTHFGSGVDTSVLALGYSYDALGLLFQATSYSVYDPFDNNFATVNQVQDDYNGLGQLIDEYQRVTGYIGTTPEVQYVYSSAALGSRLTEMIYPSGYKLHYGYNSGLDSDIGRLSFQADDNGSGGIGQHIDEYSYLGLGTVVADNRPQAGDELTYIRQPNDTLVSSDGGDQYTGLDRFGRVIDQNYVNTSTGVSTDRFQYGYDRDSNALYEDNLVNSGYSELFHDNSSSSGDDATAYDGLNRITAFEEGTLSSSGNNGSTLDTVSSPSNSQTWTLDALGNITADTGASRSSNSQNELTSDSGASPTYDNNGNMTYDGSSNTYIYDAWNRPVKVKEGASTIYTYSYMADLNMGSSHDSCAGVTTDTYYSAAGHEIEDVNSSGNVTEQYVWGLGSVPNLVLRDDNSTSGSLGKTSSGLGRRIFAQHDVNLNITALTDTSATVLQRFYYTPYGSITGNGYNWIYQFQSGQMEPYLGIKFGAREYNPTLEVWMEPDPLRYIDGLDRYQMELSNPVKYVDILGLDAARNWAGQTPEGIIASGSTHMENYDPNRQGDPYLIEKAKYNIRMNMQQVPSGWDIWWSNHQKTLVVISFGPPLALYLLPFVIGGAVVGGEATTAGVAGDGIAEGVIGDETLAAENQALNDQLGSLDSQIQSLLRQASEFQDPALQESYWNQAQELIDQADALDQQIIDNGGIPR